MSQLTKTDFILYRECPNNVWVKWHKPEEYQKFEISEFEKSLGEMGNDVEELARGMFPEGFLVERRSEGAQELTKKLISEKTPVIFQAVFSTKKYLAATDVLKWNKDAGAYDLYEIKMSSVDGEDDLPAVLSAQLMQVGDDFGKPRKVNKKRELQFEYDLAFQASVADLCGVKFNKKYLVRLNKNYVRGVELDFSKLFELTDKTEIINETFLAQVFGEMENAYLCLTEIQNLKGPCPCYYRGRSSHCTSFSISNPNVPKYSVHDLNKIGLSKKYLEKLLESGVLEIGDVPEDEIPVPKEAKDGEKQGKPKKLNQVRVHRSQKPIIDIDGITNELNSLTFPLYFLDYETYPTAIPPFSGYHPYQHIVFQYSLHILRSKDGELEHEECLILDGDPSEKIVESLRKHIGDTGSIISWYKHFENSRNKELAGLLPEHAEFLQSIIARTYDLMDIVDGQYYVHPGFKGSASIKKVQPVLAPDFSYKSLGVQNGTDAIEAYRQIREGEIIGDAKDEKVKQMLEYCMYDTKIMYIIWDFFRKLVE